MAGIPVRNFATLVGNFAAGVQGRAAALVDFSVGSVLRSVAEATSDLALWLQSVIVYVLTLTRASTSAGADLDTWYADWFFNRLPARAATGIVSFRRFSADEAVTVPVGAQVAIEGGGLIFAVYADAAHPNYSAIAGGYVLAPGVTSLDVPVAALMPTGTTNGTAWNVVAGRITEARTTIPGVDTVLNTAPFTTGVDAESDADFRAGFRLYIEGLSKGTEAAYRSAIGRLQQGIQIQVQDVPGFVTITIDDGSGGASTDLLALARPAADAVRAGGVRVTVQPATVLSAVVQMTVAVDRAYSAPDVVGRVVAALAKHVNGRGLGQPLRYIALGAVAYGIPGVTNATGITINGRAEDLVPIPTQSIKASNLIVSPTV